MHIIFLLSKYQDIKLPSTLNQSPKDLPLPKAKRLIGLEFKLRLRKFLLFHPPFLWGLSREP